MAISDEFCGGGDTRMTDRSEVGTAGEREVHSVSWNFLSRPVPLWAAATAALASGLFAFGVAFGLVKTGVVKL